MSCSSGSLTRRMSLVFVALLTCTPAMAQVVSSDFEDGTTDGWSALPAPRLPSVSSRRIRAATACWSQTAHRLFRGLGLT